MNIDNPVTLSVLFTLFVGLIMYDRLIPKSGRRFSDGTGDASRRNPFLKFVTAMGDDIYAAMPASLDKGREQRQYPRIESLLKRSGNPWGLTPREFVSLKFVAGILGFVISWPLWLGLNAMTGLPWWVVVTVVPAFCYMIPTIKHTELAKTRDLEFKRQLPEALDLITITLSGGSTLSQAIRDVIPTMQKGILKGEFINMVRIMDAGGTLKEALDEFANRAPSDGILPFVRSVQSAAEVNAPMNEILEARAEASRQEFFALVHEKAAQLESKIWIILSPTMLPALIIISVAPSVNAIIEMLGQ